MKPWRIFGYLLWAVLPVLSGCEEPPRSAHAEWSYSSVVYEMNLRQQCEEGTLAAAAQRLPMLRDLGVDVVWLMPVQPVGEKHRKGALGSYYALRRLCEIDPGYGTMEDFENFLRWAHRMGMRVIMEFVAGRTACDADWVDDCPASWYRADDGSSSEEDVRLLDYGNPEVRKAVYEALKFWTEKGVDGFHCHRAGEVPDDFWQSTWMELRRINPDLFCMSGDESPRFHEIGFDCTPSLELLQLMGDVAQGRKSGAEIRRLIERQLEEYPESAFRLAFTSDDRSNAFEGTEYERLGKAVGLATALTYVLPQGLPMIYTGQELGLNRRFPPCDKDPIRDLQPTLKTNYYRRLNHVRRNHAALRSGEKGGSLKIMPGTRTDVLVFVRRTRTDNSCVLSLFNLSAEERTVVMSRDFESRWSDALTGELLRIEGGMELVLRPWEYRVLLENTH